MHDGKRGMLDENKSSMLGPNKYLKMRTFKFSIVPGVKNGLKICAQTSKN